MNTVVLGLDSINLLTLSRMMSFLWWTKEDCLTLEMDNSGMIEWHADTSFAVHSDVRSHAGATLFMGRGAIESVSSKQKIITHSSADAEIVAADDVVVRAMWTKLFLEEQGHKINRNIVYQDNKSSILLMKNGRSSVGKRTQHMKIKYFHVTDAHNQGKGNVIRSNSRSVLEIRVYRNCH